MTATVLDPVTALVVVDLQNAVRGFPYTHPIAGVAGHAGRLAAGFRAHGLPVVLTKVGGPPPSAAPRLDRPFTPPNGAPAPDWAELVSELDVSEGDHVVERRGWGAFTRTDLEEHLRAQGVTQLVLAGVATGFGVESTARSAAELGFQLTFAVDAMSDMDADVHENSVHRIFPRLGQCDTAEAILGLLSTRPAAGNG